MALVLKINHQAIAELLNGPEITAVIQEDCQKIAGQAGPGHEVEIFHGRNRVRGTVRTATWEARYAEATQHTLTRAIDAARR